METQKFSSQSHNNLVLNWYANSKKIEFLTKEADMNIFFKSLLGAIALYLSGQTIDMVSKEFNIPKAQISQALQNPETVERAQTINQEENTNPNNVLDFFAIKEMIKRHEVGGASIDINKVYPDPIHGMSVPTIGIGYNLNKPSAKSDLKELGLNYKKVRSGKRRLSDAQVNILFELDVARAVRDGRSFLPNFSEQPTLVQTIVTDMAFNLGLTRLSKFQKLQKALTEKDYQTAAKEMKNSAWYTQVGNRSKELVNLMQSVK